MNPSVTRFPSLKSLSSAFGPEAAKALRKARNEYVNGKQTKEAYKEFQEACNRLTGGFGIEALRKEGAFWPRLEYVNQGDTYSTTLLFWYSGVFSRPNLVSVSIGCWGDAVEHDSTLTMF